MAVTQQTTGHVDSVLTNVSIAFSQMGGWVADMVMPIIPVRKESDVYYLYGIERFSHVNTKRNRGAYFNEWEWGTTTATYLCEEDGLEGYIDDRDYDNFDDPLDVEGDLVEGITEVIKLAQEKEVADLLRATGTYPDSNHYASPTAVFDTGGSSITMKKDIDALANVIRKKIGKWANTLIVPPNVARYMSYDDEIKDQVMYTVSVAGVDAVPQLVRGPEDSWLLPRVLWGYKILVPNALINAARPTQVQVPTETMTTSLSEVWGDDIWVGYVEPNPGIRKVSFGYTFQTRDMETERWREDRRKSNAFRVSCVRDRKVVCSAAGALLQNCLSSE